MYNSKKTFYITINPTTDGSGNAIGYSIGDLRIKRPEGFAVKITLDIPEDVLTPHVTVKIGQDVKQAVKDLAEWTT